MDPTRRCALLTADTTTQVIWSEPRQRYLATTRIDSTSAATTRTVLISESEDFITWQRLGTLGADRFDPVYAREFYDLPFFEVPHSGGLLVGCLNVYHIINSWEGPNCPPSPRPSWFDRLSYQLVSSRNGSSWQRAADRQVFLPNGPPESADGGIMWMYSAPVEVNGSVYFFYSGFEGTHWSVERSQYQGGVVMGAALRRDGFVSMDSAAPGGEVLTRFFAVGGAAARLVLNAATKPDAELAPMGNGTLAVEIQGANGVALPGFRLEDCLPMAGVDELAWEVRWRSATPAGLAELRGRVVRLRFSMGRAKLFSFQFQAGQEARVRTT